MSSDVRPLPPGPIEHDEDGNPVPQPADGSDVRDLQQLLEWARMKDFDLTGAIRVGKISIQRVIDLRQRNRHTSQTAGPPDRGIFAEHGYDPEDEGED